MHDRNQQAILCDRFWLLTWTMYGNWLPGDQRGFVSNVASEDGPAVRHNIPGTEFESDMPALEEYARHQLKCDPVRINGEQAVVLLGQFQATAAFRGWRLFAAGIMANHCHIVIGVPGDPEPATLLQGLKSYGSRALNARWRRPASGTWWTKSGSKRKLQDDTAVLSAIRYVVNQEYPLTIWTTEVPELELAGGRIV